jgi:hypothetical protein
MQVKVDPSGFKNTEWYEYAVRFIFGGLVAASAGLAAEKFGPGIGGIFLAFPAIFPASATLIEKHERQKKEKIGLNGTKRGRKAAGVEAAGTAMGSIGLFVFALLVWRLAPHHRSWLVFAAATLMWLGVSILIWRVRKHA